MHRKETELEAMMNEGGESNTNDESGTRTEPKLTTTVEKEAESNAVKQAECCTIS